MCSLHLNFHRLAAGRGSVCLILQNMLFRNICSSLFGPFRLKVNRRMRPLKLHNNPTNIYVSVLN
jgi:hypothetical protein